MNNNELITKLRELVKELELKEGRENTPTKNIKLVKDFNAGEVLKYAGIEWIVLEQREQGAFLLSRDILFDSTFDNSNADWGNSFLRDRLHEFDEFGYIKQSELNGINRTVLVPFTRDLMANDGTTKYGSCEDYVSILAADEYRKHRKHIPLVGDWYWLATAWTSGAVSTTTGRAMRVDYSGFVYTNNIVYNTYGVRPALVLQSDIEVEECEK